MDMFPQLREHLTEVLTHREISDSRHIAASKRLAQWISGRLVEGTQAHIIVVCTGNSRRSVLGAVMGSAAMRYFNLSNVFFYSGGTSPTACNLRTIQALRSIGIVVVPTGEEAPRGVAGELNPIYTISWGREEVREFSKVYGDKVNPHEKFAALLVCSEAEAACPNVLGADVKIGCPFVDPKESDGTPDEASVYADRRDEIGRFMLSVADTVCELLK